MSTDHDSAAEAILSSSSEMMFSVNHFSEHTSLERLMGPDAGAAICEWTVWLPDGSSKAIETLYRPGQDIVKLLEERTKDYAAIQGVRISTKIRWLSDIPHDQILYHLHQLDHSTPGIRVLILLPNANLNADPEGWLTKMSVQKAKEAQFQALSYVWGDPSDVKSMVLQGVRMPIGRNLHSALRHLRQHHVTEHLPKYKSHDMELAQSSTNSVLIWADALCINQGDMDERAEQVRLMREIYLSARPVWHWLGETNSASRRSMNIIKELAGPSPFQLTPADEDQQFSLEWQQLSFEEQWGEVLAAFTCIFVDPPFWSRMWVLQEIVLAATRASGFLRIGDDVITFYVVISALQNLQSMWKTALNKGLQSMPNFVGAGKARAHLMQIFQLLSSILEDDLSWPHLELLFRLNRELKVHDQKDRVYGLLSLLPGVQLEVDYHKSLGQLYASATLAVMRHQNSLNMLVFTDLRDDRESSVPSWASAWAERTSSVARGQKYFGSWYMFLEDFDTSASKDPTLNIDGLRLSVESAHVHTFDAAEQLGPSLALHNDPIDLKSTDEIERASASDSHAVQQFKDEAHAFYQSLICKDAHDKELLEAFSRTMMLDHYMTPDRSYDALVRISHARTLNLTGISESEDSDLLGSQFSTDNPAQEGARFVCYHSRHSLPCILPQETQVGDSLRLIAGFNFPVVMKPVEGPVEVGGYRSFRLIGTAYVDGLMDGEAIFEAPQWASTGNPDTYGLHFENITFT